MRARCAIYLVAVVAFGCGSRDNEKSARPPAEASPPAVAPSADAAPKAKESQMFEVKSSADLLALNTEYQRLWETGFDGTLEVNLASTAYTGQSWNLAPASDSSRKAAAPTIDVVLRGQGAAPPLPSLIRARKLTIEGLILANRDAPWAIEVGDEFVMKGSMLIDARARKWDRGAFMTILARGVEGTRKPAPATARIESSWFVRNFQDEDAASMLGFASVKTAPGYWDSIVIDDSAFIGNAFAVGVDVEFGKAVTVSRSLFYRSWPAGVLVKSTSSGEIVIDESVIVVESIEHVASHGAESPPIHLGKGSRIYVKDWKAGTAVPATLKAEPDQIVDRALLGAGAQTLADAAALPANALPPADLKAKLDVAARP